MISKSILFYWSKGADTRRRILLFIHKHNKKNKPCFLNQIAKELEVTHVAAKKHTDLLLEEGYISQINPKGKPIYLKITNKGIETILEFRH